MKQSRDDKTTLNYISKDLSRNSETSKPSSVDSEHFIPLEPVDLAKFFTTQTFCNSSIRGFLGQKNKTAFQESCFQKPTAKEKPGNNLLLRNHVPNLSESEIKQFYRRSSLPNGTSAETERNLLSKLLYFTFPKN